MSSIPKWQIEADNGLVQLAREAAQWEIAHRWLTDHLFKRGVVLYAVRNQWYVGDVDGVTPPVPFDFLNDALTAAFERAQHG